MRMKADISIKLDRRLKFVEPTLNLANPIKRKNDLFLCLCLSPVFCDFSITSCNIQPTNLINSIQFQLRVRATRLKMANMKVKGVTFALENKCRVRC